MTNPLKKVGSLVGLFKPVKTPEAKVEEGKVQRVAQDTQKAAEVVIEKSNEPSRASKALSKVKAFSKQKGDAVKKAVKGFFNKPKEIKNERQARQARQQYLASLEKLSNKLYNAIKGFEKRDSSNINAEEKHKYKLAAEKLFEALKEINISRKEFDEIMLNSEKRKNQMIYVDSRYGSAFKNINKDISYKEFYEILLGSRFSPVKVKYAKEIKNIASNLAQRLRNVKDVQDATKFNHDKFEIVNELAENKEYVNFIGKNAEEITKDLNKAILDKLGGKKAVEKLIKNIEVLMQSPYDFDKGVENDRSQVQKRLLAELKSRNNNISKLNKRLKELDDLEKQFAKEKQDLLSASREPTKAKYAQRREEVAKILEGYDKEREKIKEEKDNIAQEIANINEQKPKILDQLRFAHLSDLNAQRRELGKLIDLDLKDIDKLPREKTRLDTVKRYSKNAALYGVLPAAVLASIGAGYYFYDPASAIAAYEASKLYANAKVVATSNFVKDAAILTKSGIAKVIPLLGL